MFINFILGTVRSERVKSEIGGGLKKTSYLKTEDHRKPDETSKH